MDYIVTIIGIIFVFRGVHTSVNTLIDDYHSYREKFKVGSNKAGYFDRDAYFVIYNRLQMEGRFDER